MPLAYFEINNNKFNIKLDDMFSISKLRQDLAELHMVNKKFISGKELLKLLSLQLDDNIGKINKGN